MFPPHLGEVLLSAVPTILGRDIQRLPGEGQLELIRVAQSEAPIQFTNAAGSITRTCRSHLRCGTDSISKDVNFISHGPPVMMSLLVGVYSAMGFGGLAV